MANTKEQKTLLLPVNKYFYNEISINQPPHE